MRERDAEGVKLSRALELTDTSDDAECEGNGELLGVMLKQGVAVIVSVALVMDEGVGHVDGVWVRDGDADGEEEREEEEDTCDDAEHVAMPLPPFDVLGVAHALEVRTLETPLEGDSVEETVREPMGGVHDAHSEGVLETLKSGDALEETCPLRDMEVLEEGDGTCVNDAEIVVLPHEEALDEGDTLLECSELRDGSGGDAVQSALCVINDADASPDTLAGMELDGDALGVALEEMREESV